MNSFCDIRRGTKTGFSRRVLLLMLVAGLLGVMLPAPGHASLNPNRLQRVSIRLKKQLTRITLALEDSPRHSVTHLSGNRVRIALADTSGPLFRKFRSYSDVNMGGIVVSRRGENLLLTFRLAEGCGWRDVSQDGVPAVTLDVGRQLASPLAPSPLPGREKIWSGVEKLVRDFDPPLKSEFPFLPTDRQILKGVLDADGQLAFLAAEAALYKGGLSEAEEGFGLFATHQTAIRSLALYRLGETYYKLQKYAQALAAFREAERLWPAYLSLNPAVTFYYGDSIARGGDLAAARGMLSTLLAGVAEKKYAPVLLVRLADILTRQGHDLEALALYRTVSVNFSDNKASWMALLRLADRDFLRATPWNYYRLTDQYRRIYLQSNDVDLREEAFFKYVLLESLHGEASDGLREVVTFQKKFPRGVYAAVCRTMREALVLQVYRQSGWGRDHAGLIRFVEEHQDYLAGCLEQADFLPQVVKAYEESGRPIELLKLFAYLLERQWAASGAPYMYEVVADNAELLGDAATAEKSLRSFLRRYPAHPRARQMLENLGRLMYAGGNYQETRDALSWLLNRGERARLAESYYYLGRSSWVVRQFAPAYRSMELYISSGGGGGESSGRLLADAYYVAASAREASGDRRGALRLLEAGLANPALGGREELLYLAGQLNLALDSRERARSYFDRVLKEGKDPDWQKLARQSLESMDPREAFGAPR